MAKLIDRTTEQVVEGVDEAVFRADVGNPDDWDTLEADPVAEEAPPA